MEINLIFTHLGTAIERKTGQHIHWITTSQTNYKTTKRALNLNNVVFVDGFYVPIQMMEIDVRADGFRHIRLEKHRRFGRGSSEKENVKNP